MKHPSTQALRIDIDGLPPVSALLRVPDGQQAPAAGYVFAHGAGAGMGHAFMSAFADGLAERGIATLRYQFPYMEQGSKRPDTPKVAHATVRAAVAEAARRLPGLPLLAGGKSFGGRMTSQAQALAPLPGVRGLVFVGFPLHPAGKPSDERATHLSDIDLPMLFLQGTRDELAALDLLQPLLRRLGERATLALFEDADHAFHVRARSGAHRCADAAGDARCHRAVDARTGQGKLTRTYTLRCRDTVAASKPPWMPPDNADCRCRIPFKLVVIRIDDVGLLAHAADGPSTGCCRALRTASDCQRQACAAPKTCNATVPGSSGVVARMRLVYVCFVVGGRTNSLAGLGRRRVYTNWISMPQTCRSNWYAIPPMTESGTPGQFLSLAVNCFAETRRQRSVNRLGLGSRSSLAVRCPSEPDGYIGI